MTQKEIMEEKSENTENGSLFGLLSSGTPKEHHPAVLALEEPSQPKNDIKLSVEERVNELELELHKEKEKAMKYEILLKERENARLEMEHMFQTMKGQLKEEKMEQSVEIELTSSRTRVEALEKRLDEMNQLFLKALKEQKPPAENAVTSMMYQNLVSRLEDMVSATQNKIESLEEEMIQTKEKALKSEIMLRKMESFYPQVEEALAKVQDDNLKDVAGARQEVEKMVRDVKEELVKHVSILWQEQYQKIEKIEKDIKENEIAIRREANSLVQGIQEGLTKSVDTFKQEIGQLKEDIKNNETGAKQRVAETAENFKAELAGMHHRFEDVSCQLTNAGRKAEDMEKTLAKVQDDNLRRIIAERSETENMVQGIKEGLTKDTDTLRQGIGQLKEEIKNKEAVAKQCDEETAKNLKVELAEMRQRFEDVSCQLTNAGRKAEDMEKTLAKVQDDNLKVLTDVRGETANMVQGIKEELTKDADTLRQGIGQVRSEVEKNEVVAEQRSKEIIGNFKTELDGMRNRFEGISCQLASACRKADDVEKALTKTRDDSLADMANVRHELENLVGGIKEETGRTIINLETELGQKISGVSMRFDEMASYVTDKLERMAILEERLKKVFKQVDDWVEEIPRTCARIDNFNEELAATCSRIAGLEEKSTQSIDLINGLQTDFSDERAAMESLRQGLLQSKETLSEILKRELENIWLEMNKTSNVIREEFRGKVLSHETAIDQSFSKTSDRIDGIEKEISGFKTHLVGALTEGLKNIAAWQESVFKIMKGELKEHIYALDSQGTMSQKIFARKNELIDLMTKINIEIGRLHNEFLKTNGSSPAT